MTDAEQEHSRTQHLTHEEVAHLVGELDDATIAAILETGAHLPGDRASTQMGRRRPR